jgi:hypothetical protein
VPTWNELEESGEEITRPLSASATLGRAFAAAAALSSEISCLRARMLSFVLERLDLRLEGLDVLRLVGAERRGGEGGERQGGERGGAQFGG